MKEKFLEETVLAVFFVAIVVIVNHYCSLEIGKHINGYFTDYPFVMTMLVMIVLYKAPTYILQAGNHLVELFQYLCLKITGAEERDDD